MKIKGYDFKVYIKEKNIKNMNLRLIDAQVLLVTCPFNTEQYKIEKFIKDHEDWILKQRQRIDTSFKGFHDPIYYLGKKYNLVIKDGRASMSIVGDTITITSINADFEKARRYFYKKADEAINEVLDEFKDKYYEILKSLGYKKEPIISYKLLKSRWGKCSYNDNNIELNELLIHYPKEAIEYVFWHECAHFLVQNHSKQFHQLLDKYMPDNKERTRLLH